MTHQEFNELLRRHKRELDAAILARFLNSFPGQRSVAERLADQINSLSVDLNTESTILPDPAPSSCVHEGCGGLFVLIQSVAVPHHVCDKCHTRRDV